MKEYHKIQTVFKRDEKGRIIEGDWTLPEFDLLQDIEWEWTEKIDGTNIRIIWDGEMVRFGGKTDNAQIPSFLLNVLQDLFPVEKMARVFTGPVCLYGEGYGAKIQKGGGNYLSDSVNFILFDIRAGDWWLTRGAMIDIAFDLGINIVPLVGWGILKDAIDMVGNGFKSMISENKDFAAEGLVLRPKLELFARNGERIITKIKSKDFV